jgi:LemA protein
MNKYLFGLALSIGLMSAGCDASKHMEDMGFKKGEGVVEKGVIKYDTLVEKDEICNESWSNYEAQLQRRADLIPMLVNTVKGYATHEQETLTKVMEARAAATQIKMTSEDLTNPEKMAAFQKAQDQMKGSLSRLMVVQENYPTLKADGRFHDLMVSMEGTENRILIARKNYNKSVMEYNVELRRVSGKAINPVTGFEFKPRLPFSADENAKVAPKVDFSK